jgi:hypothetical protein
VANVPLRWCYFERTDHLDAVRLRGERQDLAAILGDEFALELEGTTHGGLDLRPERRLRLTAGSERSANGGEPFRSGRTDAPERVGALRP